MSALNCMGAKLGLLFCKERKGWKCFEAIWT